MQMIEHWCQCFPSILEPEPTAANGQQMPQPTVDVLTAAPPMAGDKYFVRRVVGSGATGTALIGRRARDNLPIIAKVVDLGEMDASQKQRTESEIECLSKCHHSAIIQYLAHHVVDSKLLVVMELADAGDLGFQIKHRREAKSFFMEQEVALMLTQIMIAVDYIHSQSILHRDMKPANIFVKTNGLVKVGDFGLSKIFEETVSRPVADSLVGTPYYLAPEVWKREKYGKKADMFSLGVLWYEMLTLERPFKGTSVTAVMNAIVEGQFAPLPSHISADTAQLVIKLLSPNPEVRPSILEVFESPLMDHSLRIFSSMIVQNLPGSSASKIHVMNDALTFRNKVQQHLQQKFCISNVLPSTDTVSQLQVSSPMVHLEEGKKWKHRLLKLNVEASTLQIARTVTASSSSTNPVNDAATGVSADGSTPLSATKPSAPENILRTISLIDILYMSDVPSCFAEGRGDVFSIILRNGDEALWFYSVADPQAADAWRERLSQATGKPVLRLLSRAPQPTVVA